MESERRTAVATGARDYDRGGNRGKGVPGQYGSAAAWSLRSRLCVPKALSLSPVLSREIRNLPLGKSRLSLARTAAMGGT